MRTFPLPEIPLALLRVAVGLGVAGTLASLAVHVAVSAGWPLPESLVFPLHLGAMVVAAPVILALIGRAESELERPAAPSFAYSLRLTAWTFRILSPVERFVFGGMLLYTLYQFVQGFAASAPTGAFPAGLFSAVWLYFFSFSALYGWRLLRLGAPTDAPRRA